MPTPPHKVSRPHTGQSRARDSPNFWPGQTPGGLAAPSPGCPEARLPRGPARGPAPGPQTALGDPAPSKCLCLEPGPEGTTARRLRAQPGRLSGPTGAAPTGQPSLLSLPPLGSPSPALRQDTPRHRAPPPQHHSLGWLHLGPLTPLPPVLSLPHGGEQTGSQGVPQAAAPPAEKRTSFPPPAHWGLCLGAVTRWSSESKRSVTLVPSCWAGTGHVAADLGDTLPRAELCDRVSGRLGPTASPGAAWPQASGRGWGQLSSVRWEPPARTEREGPSGPRAQAQALLGGRGGNRCHDKGTDATVGAWEDSTPVQPAPQLPLCPRAQQRGHVPQRRPCRRPRTTAWSRAPPANGTSYALKSGLSGGARGQHGPSLCRLCPAHCPPPGVSKAASL